MNIVVRELYAHKKSLIIWSVSMIAFVMMMFAEFAAYYKNPEILAVLEAFPPEMLQAFGMAGANLTTVTGYMSVAVVFIALTLGTYALLLGNNIIAKEERDKTAGFLLTLPVSRTHLITQKLIAATLSSLILLLVVAASILVAVLPYQVEEHFGTFMALVILTIFIIMLIFLSIGMLLAAVTKRHKLSGGIGIALISALYLASIIASLSDSMAFLKYVSPFAYFEAPQLLRDLGLEPIKVALSALIIGASLFGTYTVYSRRDL